MRSRRSGGSFLLLGVGEPGAFIRRFSCDKERSRHFIVQKGGDSVKGVIRLSSQARPFASCYPLTGYLSAPFFGVPNIILVLGMAMLSMNLLRLMLRSYGGRYR